MTLTPGATPTTAYKAQDAGHRGRDERLHGFFTGAPVRGGSDIGANKIRFAAGPGAM